MVKVSFVGYIVDAVYEFTEDVTTPVVSPASEHFFVINNIGKRLIEERAILFHRLVIKLIFVSNCSMPEIIPTIGFLTTRV